AEKDSRDLIQVLSSYPESEAVWSVTASWGGFGGMKTGHWKDRKRSTGEMLPEGFGRLSRIPGVQVLPRLDPPLPDPGQYDVELMIQSDLPPERMQDVVAAVRAAGFESKKFMYVETDLKFDLPEARVVIDRERLADLGLDLAGVGQGPGTLLRGGDRKPLHYLDRQ